MTRNYILAAAAAMLALPASSAVPFSKGQHPIRKGIVSAPLRAASETVVNEDFSKFTGGTPDTPGEEISYENGYHIPDALMAQPGWTGGGIFPMAGSIALMDRAGLDQLGFISTPAVNLGGTATLTFKARTLPGSKGGSLWVALCDDYYGPGDDQMDFVLTEEWKEYTMVATHGSLEDPSYFQIQAENGYVQLDDVRIDFKRDRLMSPRPLRAVNLSPTSFKACWESVDAPTYRLNVWCKEAPEEIVKGVIIEGFDNINVNADGKTIDTSSPNYPEGWIIDLSSKGAQEVSREAGTFNSAPQSLYFDAVGDMVTSPETPQPLNGFKFWVKPTSMMENEEVLSLLRVEIFHTLTGKWETIAQLPYYWMVEQGAFYEVPADALGDDSNRVRLSFLQKGDINFYIDDVTLSYASQGVMKKYIEDLDVEGTEYVVADIDPANEYSYYVQAVDGDIVSEPSYTIWVDGVEGLKPEVGEATEISEDSFTANWQPLGHATDYRVDLSSIVTASADMKGVLVNEETFDGITTEGTDWVSPYNYADKGMTDTPWCSTNPMWKPGMAGTQGTSYFGEAGLVFSPRLNLSGNNGEGFDVEATVETTVASIPLEDGTEYPEGMFVMVLNTHNDSQALCSAYFDTPTVGSHTAKVHVANPDGIDLSDVIVAFMNVTGTPFFVDEVKIMQDLRVGETLTAPLSVRTTQDTSIRIDGLESGRTYGYSVTASVMKNFENYVSAMSDVVTVETATSGIGNVNVEGSVSVSAGKGVLSITAPDTADVSVYTAGGVKIAEGMGSMSLAVVPGIYIVKAGDKTEKMVVR